jgi:hypothetical protein
MLECYAEDLAADIVEIKISPAICWGRADFGLHGDYQ